jgi:hypothetical protein
MFVRDKGLASVRSNLPRVLLKFDQFPPCSLGVKGKPMHSGFAVIHRGFFDFIFFFLKLLKLLGAKISFKINFLLTNKATFTYQ